MLEPLKIGEFSAKVVETLNLDVPVGTPILITASNTTHMAKTHPKEFTKYYSRIDEIIEKADYIGINGKDDSIEYIKIFSKNIKVAVRIAKDGEYYARTLYEVGQSRLMNSIKNGQLKPLTKE